MLRIVRMNSPKENQILGTKISALPSLMLREGEFGFLFVKRAGLGGIRSYPRSWQRVVCLEMEFSQNLLMGSLSFLLLMPHIRKYAFSI